MASQILTNCKLYSGGYDLSGDTNKLNLSFTVEDKDNTTFGMTAHSRIAGLRDLQIEHDGFNNNANAQPGDSQLFAQLGAAEAVTSVLVDGTDGGNGYFSKLIATDYTPVAGATGDVYAYTVKLAGTSDLYRGTVLLPPSPTVTTTGTGTARQLGAVSAAQSVRAALHVFSVGGTASPTLTMKVQSAASSGFASPNDRITFAGATAVGAQLGTTAGAITDTWWRVSYTISGTNPVFGAVVTVSIQ